MLTDNIRTAAACPNLQLVGSGSTEGISGNQQYLFPLLGKLRSDLTNGCRFADTIDANNQHHRRLGVQLQLGISYAEHLN